MSRILLDHCFFFCFFISASLANVSPAATVTNGTYVGKYVPEWGQDQWLGIPFAQPPVGDLRFAWPQSLNASFDAPRDATSYGFSCYQYGTNFNLSEDCLTLNSMLIWMVTNNEPLANVFRLSHPAGRYFINGQTACLGLDLRWRTFHREYR